ncbi:MAG: transposase [Pseudomonadota bacterium]|jgi:transposase|nr:transposase [Caenispirillum sp.]
MSEHTSELSARLVVGRKRDGRNVYSKQAKRELVEACLRPGVSVARIAYEHGLNANLLRKWITLYREVAQPPATEAVALIPVVQAHESACRRAAPADVAGCLEIVVSDATIRVRGAVDPRQLRLVLDCLARRP